ncbi:uncharacterized protein LOC125959300 [Anopheles darlingi]|uniref:uncharacterized protein LOC125959300 n=1 Tax=Anopheles darlingi TaxID=43151 RepID=UPI00210002D7|nr:uncharacterized protein LOC125959300 [Anopheles darlingi]
MLRSRSCLPMVAIVALLLGVASCASIASNLIEERPRIASSEELLSSIVNECFADSSVMGCLKGKVLLYLDGVLGLREEQARAFDETNVDKVIFDRVARVLATHEIRVQLPEDTVVSYRADKGLDIDVLPAGLATEARGHLLKKKLLLPVLLLLKLKLKALMPIFLGLIGLKAMKALILSKLAITLVLGFLIAQLVKKSGLGMPMSMMPMMPSAPAAEYGAPAPATSTSSYDPSSWEPQSGGPYSRVWEPSSSASSHNLAYSSYYPSSSSSYTAYNSGSSSVSSSGSSSSSSPSSSSSAAGSSASSSSSSNAAHAY